MPPSRFPSVRPGALAAILAAALAVAACGVKGDLEPPPGAKPAEVRNPNFPGPVPEDGATPSRPFILDGLLK